MLIDTHTHLYLPEFDTEPDGPIRAVERAVETGIGHMVLPNVDLTTIAPMKALHERFPQATSMAMGLHPTEIGEGWRDHLAQVHAELTDGTPYVAVGEVGIDLYWDKTFESQQMQAFDAQMQWAKEMNIPVIIHCREGLDQVLEVLQAYPDATGVMHSFTGSTADAERVLKTVERFHFGINGIVTFKNSGLRAVLPAIGLDRLLLETDSPYLAPVPHRGRRNESAYLIHTAAYTADALGVDLPHLTERTTANASRLFNI